MNTRAFIACTGAGAGAQASLWQTPGCSAYLAGAAFPYAPDQLAAFLGFTPKRACSPETALELAMAAYLRAWSDPADDAIGIGLTAVVATAAVHRGDHRIHAAAVTSSGAWSIDLTLSKASGAAARREDGERADALVLALLDAARGGSDWSTVGATDATSFARELFFQRPLFDEVDQRLSLDALGAGPIFPGAFNPPHPGHFGAANACEQAPTFMICASPPNKPALSLAELLQRAKMLHGRRRAFTENDSFYIEKARRFPQRAILIGADALERLLDERWGVPIVPMLKEFAALGTRFLVFGRRMGDAFVGATEVLEAASVPNDARALFVEIAGRWDASSTALREAAAIASRHTAFQTARSSFGTERIDD
ncbi:MAG TPA: hypothetical protein VER96_07510 [Polyangiaceae bacterium]|nr:hypothetical protein [Polyangiaceae bacterium]